MALTIQDENSTEFLCDLYEQESSWSNKQKPNLNSQNRETPSVPRLESICRPQTPWTKGMFVSSNILQRCQKYILLLFLGAFPKGTCGLLLGWLCTGEKEIIRLFRIYWTLALNWHWVQDIQNITAVLVQARVCRGQVMNGVLGPSHSGLCTHTGVISPVLECTVRIFRLILSNWQNPFIGSMTLEVRVILWERAKWKPLQLPLPWMSKVVAVAVLEVI